MIASTDKLPCSGAGPFQAKSNQQNSNKLEQNERI